ncbi:MULTISPECIES: hypothetical protein [Pseudonocardia]|uniref:Uncharacterized protein n=3 Tax=Pseudonocardia TaxID=1847 RepID=A0A1I5FTC6_PSUAM|nr:MULTISPECIES: hypothetical protein [Pseudonocardia]OSY36634.1 hypothetical protein BG845_05239 [Pseudonocardia autotrophica]TDN65463.1 hypothetical protein C8E95_6952 [Pseudonocardia autotrophica]SFO26992.1 hypothetical protein SAMN05216207_104054 [Pseudonocardia ammonioxydans]BBG05885.1 hypothetical protein Pdca_70940 [Pseudonocardia autotrophica]GEC26855.1 hypothetical protein PSA01_38840 [Pseudonocardia saturnea]
MTALDAVRAWTLRYWTVAALTTLATVVLVAVPTAVVPNPWFWREIPTPDWAYPVLGLVAVLSGLVAATYVRAPDGPGGRRASAGALLGFLAVGCPVCNKLVLLVLGYTGAITWFEPVQPVLAVLAVVGLAAALRARLRGATACPLPSTPSASGSTDTRRTATPRAFDATEPHPLKEDS